MRMPRSCDLIILRAIIFTSRQCYLQSLMPLPSNANNDPHFLAFLRELRLFMRSSVRNTLLKITVMAANRYWSPFEIFVATLHRAGALAVLYDSY